MNAIVSKPADQVQVAVLLPAEDRIELEWAGVLDCGALGPSREEPALFNQDREGWAVDCRGGWLPGGEEVAYGDFKAGQDDGAHALAGGEQNGKGKIRRI